MSVVLAGLVVAAHCLLCVATAVSLVVEGRARWGAESRKPNLRGDVRRDQMRDEDAAKEKKAKHDQHQRQTLIKDELLRLQRYGEISKWRRERHGMGVPLMEQMRGGAAAELRASFIRQYGPSGTRLRLVTRAADQLFLNAQ